ncbi:peptide ABC transporter permease [Amorphus orientalis]|uniref:Peptide ABC transporter permease n=1 Tax=Amorphus orientalis TaxID=649198 RepID=A0AAE3VNK5_9HYPH|nr:peptide ABC transporter permease [Amorphus orientalis]MDQ0315332.1 hypothetical protein [Amorphus orientalis]
MTAPDDRDADGRPVYSAKKVRQGEVNLSSRARRSLFGGGLAGIVVVGLLLIFLV